MLLVNEAPPLLSHNTSVCAATVFASPTVTFSFSEKYELSTLYQNEILYVTPSTKSSAGVIAQVFAGALEV